MFLLHYCFLNLPIYFDLFTCFLLLLFFSRNPPPPKFVHNSTFAPLLLKWRVFVCRRRGRVRARNVWFSAWLVTETESYQTDSISLPADMTSRQPLLNELSAAFTMHIWLHVSLLAAHFRFGYLWARIFVKGRTTGIYYYLRRQIFDSER